MTNRRPVWSITNEVAGGFHLLHAVERACARARDHAGGAAGRAFRRLLCRPAPTRPFSRTSPRDFETTESRFWNSSLKIVGFERVRQVAWRPWGLDYIPRRYCTGTVVVSDGYKRRINFSIREDLGFIGIGWDTECLRRRPRPPLCLRAALQAGRSLILRRCLAFAGACLLSDPLLLRPKLPGRRGAPRWGSSTSMCWPCPGRRASARTAAAASAAMRQRQRARLRDPRPVAAERAGLSQLLRARRALRAPGGGRGGQGPFPGRQPGPLSMAQARDLHRREPERLFPRRAAARDLVRIPDGFKGSGSRSQVLPSEIERAFVARQSGLASRHDCRSPADGASSRKSASASTGPSRLPLMPRDRSRRLPRRRDTVPAVDSASIRTSNPHFASDARTDMNYRHAFHAGNFADVMKHALLVRILAYLQRKETPLARHRHPCGDRPLRSHRRRGRADGGVGRRHRAPRRGFLARGRGAPGALSHGDRRCARPPRRDRLSRLARPSCANSCGGRIAACSWSCIRPTMRC